MKKLSAILALTLMVIGLTGCMDPQDGSGGKLPPSKLSSSIQLN
ncbi:hypothetical protein [Methylocucumis oryzae]|nr:hypothetical protein [Methylocucumis oryzae]